MLDVLRQRLADKTSLRALLGQTDWRSLDITYHPPRVERVWRQHGDQRLFLHRIHPCEESAALWHPHDWPSAMYVVRGRYEHKLGYLPGAQPGDELADHEHGHAVRCLTTAELNEGSLYELTDPLAWHSVRPLGEPALSIMVTGPLWSPGERLNFPKPMVEQTPLPPEVVAELLATFASAI